MGWRFRKSIKILPGVKLNFGKRGFTSTTFGGKYFKTNVSKKGTYNTFSLPGTGLSYRSKVSGGNSNQSQIGSNATFYDQAHWRCQCGMLNLPKTENCESCGQINGILRRQKYGLDWYCNNCFSANLANTNFCGNCGNIHQQEIQSTTTPEQYRKSLKIFGIAVGIPALLIFLLLVGVSVIIPKNQLDNSSKSAEAVPYRAIPSVPIETPKNLALSPTVSKTPTVTKKALTKTATIISQNANLRDSPNSSGNVTDTISEGSSIRVIKQSGAWFYVESSGQKGWMHGNTIRLDSQAAGSEPTLEPSVSNETPVTDYTPTYSPDFTPSYSTGGTVFVHGYTRRNGTYVNSYTRSAPHSRH